MKFRTIITLVLVFSLALCPIFLISQGNAVNTADQAVSLAQNHIETLHGNKFADCDYFEIEEQDDVWVVSFASTNEKYKYMAGGGFPMVFIDKENDRNVEILYQK